MHVDPCNFIRSYEWDIPSCDSDSRFIVNFPVASASATCLKYLLGLSGIVTELINMDIEVTTGCQLISQQPSVVEFIRWNDTINVNVRSDGRLTHNCRRTTRLCWVSGVISTYVCVSRKYAILSKYCLVLLEYLIGGHLLRHGTCDVYCRIPIRANRKHNIIWGCVYRGHSYYAWYFNYHLLYW